MKTCLIVDDSKVIRKVARHILETLEFQVEEAGDGREALTRCEAAMPTSRRSSSAPPKMTWRIFVRRLKPARMSM